MYSRRFIEYADHVNRTMWTIRERMVFEVRNLVSINKNSPARKHECNLV